jgi:hypothetical protein
LPSASPGIASFDGFRPLIVAKLPLAPKLHTFRYSALAAFAGAFADHSDQGLDGEMAANNTSGVLWAEFRKPSGTESLGVIADLQAVARHEPFRIAGMSHQRAWSFSTQAEELKSRTRRRFPLFARSES